MESIKLLVALLKLHWLDIDKELYICCICGQRFSDEALHILFQRSVEWMAYSRVSISKKDDSCNVSRAESDAIY